MHPPVIFEGRAIVKRALILLKISFMDILDAQTHYDNLTVGRRRFHLLIVEPAQTTPVHDQLDIGHHHRHAHDLLLAQY